MSNNTQFERIGRDLAMMLEAQSSQSTYCLKILLRNNI